ncbi:SprT family zinc-dependent metalloprotease [Prochlorococcus sp. MIT 1223]|uniref:SprT family zinc-dependent metalloprotease n=1 Tax=Prochlorococcus sp. MIT 1223 TaxID=3096217 RepID=UPI002A74EC04|nr:SprT family zinc-dependent metalloprotease [Prochlorococcus sp. MIT 1223]
MPLLPLLPIFHRLNREYFDGLLVKEHEPIVSVRWSDGRLRNTAGFYQRGPSVAGRNGCQIVLSRPVLINLPKSAIQSTLCHEMIHAWIDRVLKVREAHGPNFRARMQEINASQNEFEVNIRHNFPVQNKRPKWIATCPLCGTSSFYKRLLKGAACKHCCDILHGGKWHASCLLIYEPILRN